LETAFRTVGRSATFVSANAYTDIEKQYKAAQKEIEAREKHLRK
jgi:hypothetical protein